MHTDRKQIFAERLKQAAVAKYKKQHGIVTRISEDVGVSVQAVSKWLRGEMLPREDYWGVIAAKLNVSTEWLMGLTHEPPEQLADIPDDSLRVASAAARIVFPLAMRLKSDINQDELDKLFKHAYQELKSGRSENAISGDVASRLIQN